MHAYLDYWAISMQYSNPGTMSIASNQERRFVMAKQAHCIPASCSSILPNIARVRRMQHQQDMTEMYLLQGPSSNMSYAHDQFI